MQYAWVFENFSTLASAAGVLVGAVYGGVRHLRSVVRTEVQDFAASKEDVLRLEAKVDAMLSVSYRDSAPESQPAPFRLM